MTEQNLNSMLTWHLATVAGDTRTCPIPETGKAETTRQFVVSRAVAIHVRLHSHTAEACKDF